MGSLGHSGACEITPGSFQTAHVNLLNFAFINIRTSPDVHIDTTK